MNSERMAKTVHSKESTETKEQMETKKKSANEINIRVMIKRSIYQKAVTRKIYIQLTLDIS